MSLNRGVWCMVYTMSRMVLGWAIELDPTSSVCTVEPPYGLPQRLRRVSWEKKWSKHAETYSSSSARPRLPLGADPRREFRQGPPSFLAKSSLVCEQVLHTRHLDTTGKQHLMHINGPKKARVEFSRPVALRLSDWTSVRVTVEKTPNLM